jgi:hypothetical protein
MPRGDGTGPMGMGPMTGRAAGFCAGYSVPGFSNPYGGRFGRGMGFGRGRGMGGWGGWGGFRFGYPYMQPVYGAIPPGPAYSREQEIEWLKNQAKAMEDQMSGIHERISELESKSE